MTEDIADIVTKDVSSLRGIRDELRLQLALGRAEARERFEGLEKQWSHLEGKLHQLGEASREDLSGVEAAARLLMEEIREGYRHVKSLL